MAKRKLPKKSIEFVRNHRSLSITIGNLNGSAGMSQKTIHTTLNKQTKVHISRNDIRAALERYDVSYRRVKGKANARLKLNRNDRVITEAAKSQYRQRLPDNIRAGPSTVARLDRQFAMGYMIRSNVDPRELKMEQSLIDWYEREDKYGSPPF